MAFNLSYLFDRVGLFRSAMERVLDLYGRSTAMQGLYDASEGRLTVFQLQDVARAHALIESGRSTGKIVLCTDPSDGQ